MQIKLFLFSPSIINIWYNAAKIVGMKHKAVILDFTIDNYRLWNYSKLNNWFCKHFPDIIFVLDSSKWKIIAISGLSSNFQGHVFDISLIFVTKLNCQLIISNNDVEGSFKFFDIKLGLKNHIFILFIRRMCKLFWTLVLIIK